jgi:nucleotide-binding universal stress UspA family protein
MSNFIPGYGINPPNRAGCLPLTQTRDRDVDPHQGYRTLSVLKEYLILWVEETPSGGDPHLFKNILIPTDGSDLATKAVDQGVLFAKEIDAKITAMTVTEPFHLLSAAPSQLEYTPIEYKKHAEAYAERVLGIVSVAAKSAGVGCETLHVEHEHVYQAIIDAAASRRCDLILMASHGRRGVSAVVLGSETVKVLTHSKIPVLVYR